MPTILTHQLLLASNSPRRKELLGMISPEYRIAIIHDIDESYPAAMPPMEIPEY
ncbi:MAG: Maf family protein, partial [Muribaculaceae bacterium]|nr:Maf family protein [Muribaculaceae bacterium]